VFGIIEQSGGSVWVYSEPGRGATFKIYLPRVDAPVEPRSPTAPAGSGRGSETVLVVDDDDPVRAAACGILRRHGYQVLEARTPDQAAHAAEHHPGTIHLLLTDVVMPVISGPELAKRITKLRPDIKVICMSGYTDDSIVRHGVLESQIAYLQKPLAPNSLTAKVREVLDG
jgi:DNA-binding NtrC family response regulator